MPTSWTVQRGCEVSRLQFFGPNVGHDPVYHPSDIASAGFNSLRIVGQRHVYLRDYFGECQTYGIEPAMVICNESFNFDGRRMTYPEAAEYYAGTYAGRDDGRGVACWMIGNETDGVAGENPESGLMAVDEFNEMARAFLQSIRARDEAVPIYAVGTVTGDPNRLEGYDFTGFTGLDNHAYAQWPESVGGMLGNYDRFDERYGLTSRICSEFGWPDGSPSNRGQYVAGMAAAFETLGLAGAWVYCWELAQHAQPFGIGSRFGQPLEEALQYIRPLGYTPGAQAPVEPAEPLPEPPVQPAYVFAQGFLRMADRLGTEIVGQAAGKQWFPSPGVAFQQTTAGRLRWIGPRWLDSMVDEHEAPVVIFESAEDGITRVLNEVTGEIKEYAA